MAPASSAAQLPVKIANLPVADPCRFAVECRLVGCCFSVEAADAVRHRRRPTFIGFSYLESETFTPPLNRESCNSIAAGVMLLGTSNTIVPLI